MTTFPRSPRLQKGGIVLLNPQNAAIERIITLQYNPDTLTRSLQVQDAGGEGGDRSDALRLTGPPVETYSIEAELDATDQLQPIRTTLQELARRAALQYDNQRSRAGCSF